MNVRKIATGTYLGDTGAFWVWRFDGYYDIHFVIDGEHGPQPHNVIAEGYVDFKEAVGEIKDLLSLDCLTV